MLYGIPLTCTMAFLLAKQKALTIVFIPLEGCIHCLTDIARVGRRASFQGILEEPEQAEKNYKLPNKSN